MKPKRSGLDLPLPRYEGLGRIQAIVKKTQSRCACFWLDVANVSGSGVGIVYQGNGHVPFSIADDLQVTLDTACAVFRRPIHVYVQVKWRDELPIVLESGLLAVRTTLGCQITMVDPIHFPDWSAGLQRLSAHTTR